MVEILSVIVIIGIVSALALVAWYKEMPMLRADSAMQLMEATLRQAREAAVDERRNVMVTFQGTGEMVTCSSGTLPGHIACPNTNGTPAPVSEISDLVLDPSQMTFQVLSGVLDTPDAFGYTTPECVTSSGICFNNNTCGTTATLPCYITFQSDGTVVNSAGTYINGTVFIGAVGNARNPTNPLTARAVTVLGTTGRIKGYRWTGTQWY
jgi:Tfp pilus assembly protein FimT